VAADDRQLGRERELGRARPQEVQEPAHGREVAPGQRPAPAAEPEHLEQHAPRDRLLKRDWIQDAVAAWRVRADAEEHADVEADLDRVDKVDAEGRGVALRGPRLTGEARSLGEWFGGPFHWIVWRRRKAHQVHVETSQGNMRLERTSVRICPVLHSGALWQYERWRTMFALLGQGVSHSTECMRSSAGNR